MTGSTWLDTALELTLWARWVYPHVSNWLSSLLFRYRYIVPQKVENQHHWRIIIFEARLQWFNSNKGRSCLHWPVWNSSGQNHRWTKCFWKLKLLIDQLPPVMSKHKKYWLHQILSNFPMNRTWSSRTSLVPRNDLGRLSWPKQQHNQVVGLDFIFAQHCNRHFIASMESAAFVDIIHTNGDLEPSAASLWVRAECIFMKWNLEQNVVNIWIH